MADTKYLTGEEALEAKRQGALAALADGSFFQKPLWYAGAPKLFIQSAEIGDPNSWSIPPEKLAALEQRAAEFDAKEHRMIDRVTGEPRGFPPRKR